MKRRMERRVLWVHMGLLLLFCGVLLRVFVIGQGEQYQKTASAQSRYTLSAGTVRGTIYDCTLRPLVNNGQQTLLAVDPIPAALTALRQQMPEEEFTSLLPLLQGGKPTLVRTDATVAGEGITVVHVPRRYSEQQIAPHVIGYVDGENRGVCGIEAGYDDELTRWGGEIAVRYTVNAWQQAIGSAPEVSDRSSIKAGVVLTLDRQLQEIAEREAAVLGKGAVVLMEADTGCIRAMVSVPGYDVNRVSEVLDSADSPLLNRATAAWNVGSIFKVCVAAAALENGVEPPADYCCEGYYRLGDHAYFCHERSGHGTVNLQQAMEESCNPYFVELGQQTGAESLLRMAQRMGFGSRCRLAKGIYSAAGTLPSLEKTTDGELANLSFGQGQLTATPVQIAAMLAAVANGGCAVQPSLLAGKTFDSETLQAEPAGEPIRVVCEETAQTLRKLLVSTVENGTGFRAANRYCGSGGKTASAQTGRYENGEEVVHAWFGGFFPAENPKYVLVVFQEGGRAGGQTPATVFRAISEAVYCAENPGPTDYGD